MLIAVVTLLVLGLLIGLGLGWAAVRFRVESDPVIDQIDAVLPQTQCGQCGYPGCRPYAEAIASDEADINQCPPGGEAGIRALAVLSEERETALAETPTAAEQGIAAYHNLTQYWWAPKNTPPDRVAALAELLQRAMETESVRQRLAELHIAPIFLTGDSLQKTIAEREAELKEVKVDPPPSLPPFEWLALGLAVICGAFVYHETNSRKDEA